MLHEPVSVDVQPLSNAAGRNSGSFQYLDSGSTAPGEANITSDSSRPWTGIKSKYVYFSMHGCIYMYIYICVHTHTYNIYTVAIVYIYTYSISYIYTHIALYLQTTMISFRPSAALLYTYHTYYRYYTCVYIYNYTYYTYIYNYTYSSIFTNYEYDFVYPAKCSFVVSLPPESPGISPKKRSA